MSEGYIAELDAVAATDVEHVKQKDATYGGSWAKRGGAGAFMMLARKWDRLENMLSRREQGQYDLFSALDEQDLLGADGSILAEVRDLRRYLLLVEARLLYRAKTPDPKQTIESHINDIYDDVAKSTGVPVRDVRAIVMIMRAHPNMDIDSLAQRYSSLSGARVHMNSALLVLQLWSGEGNRKKSDRPVPLEDSNRHAERD